MYFLYEAVWFIGTAALCVTPAMFLFGAATYFRVQPLRRTSTLVCLLAILPWVAYVVLAVIGPEAPPENAGWDEVIPYISDLINLAFVFFIAIDILFLLAVGATFSLGRKLCLRLHLAPQFTLKAVLYIVTIVCIILGLAVR